MTRSATFGLLGIALAWTAVSLGCSKEEAAKPPAAADQQAAPADATADTSPMNVDASEIEKNLANLSSEDRKLAEEQKTCPVSGEALGSMGTPIPVSKDGKTIFICCEGCKEKVEANFADYLAKIDAKKTEAPKEEATN